MSAEPLEAAAPRPKAPMPRLDTRAPRPRVVRLRRAVVTALVMSGAALVAGALAWTFVVQPDLRAQAARRDEPPGDVAGAVRPSDRIMGAPATYGQLGPLPEPRGLGGAPRTSADAPARTRAAADPGRGRAAATPGEGRGQEARASRLFFGDAAAGSAPAAGGAPQGADPGGAGVYNTHALLAPRSPYEVKAGAILPAALLTAVDTTHAGPVVATLTENVFDSVSGRHLLIPQGARLIGTHEGDTRYGDARAVITWDRLILPNGKSLVLGKEPGVDAQGAMGVKGATDRRLGPLMMATLVSGAITALGQVARDHDDRSGGILGDAGDAAAIEAAQTGGKLIDRELDVHPVIRLRPGARVRVLITRDLILEPYRS